MTPSEVKRYLTERKVAPLNDIAIHFDMEPDAVRGLLGHWIRKGRVRLHQDESCNSGGCCGDCGTHVKEVYEWLQQGEGLEPTEIHVQRMAHIIIEEIKCEDEPCIALEKAVEGGKPCLSDKSRLPRGKMANYRQRHLERQNDGHLDNAGWPFFVLPT